MSPITKVFDIHELTQLIADNLTQHDLALCCLVNKSFSATFTPHLWHSITIHPKDSIPKFQSPEGRAGLLRNGHLIRVLQTYNPIALEPFVEFGTTCKNLISLDVNHKIGSYSSSILRTSEMLSKVRGNGSISTGQKQTFQPSLFGVATLSTGFGQLDASASVAGEFIAPTTRLFPTRQRSTAEWESDGESYLVSVLKRNPQLEFLVVPSHCLDCEAIVRVAGESLLSLKEFYSDTELWPRRPFINFRLSAYPTGIDSSHMVASSEVAAAVEGCLQLAGGELLHPILSSYPRLRELQTEITAKTNHDALEQIRFADKRLACLEMTHGHPPQVAQILTLTPPLKHLSLSGLFYHHSAYDSNDITIKEAFLRHAPTLEHFDTSTCDFSPMILRALLCSAPSLRTLKTMEEDLGYRPYKEVELDALRVITSPWSCIQLEMFECKILNVPRPDIVNTTLEFAFFNPGLPPGPPLGPAVVQDQTPLTGAMLVAQQESHSVQRQVLQQLGRLTHLRVLRLGKYGRDWDGVDFSRLEIRGIRTMIVDAYTDRNCLELSLESGLDELCGLQELEELNVYQMAHRIGLAEVQWMAEHWPRLKSIIGLQYIDYDHVMDHGDEVEGVGSQVESEPEHVRWLRENRPDITLQ